MKKFFRKISYKHRIAAVILLFTLFPCLLLEMIYLKNVQQNWKQVALTSYQSEADSSALLTSQNITSMQSKMEYVINSSSARSYIAKVNNLSLMQELDLVYTLNEIADSITADNNSLEVRWYPHLSTLSYGNYCYTLDMLAKEFPLGNIDSDFQDILALDEVKVLWTVRYISRAVNNKGTPEERLCLYTQMTNLNGSDCVLEFSIPVSQMRVTRSSAMVSDSLFAICLSQGHTTNNIILDSTLAAEKAQSLLAHYRQTGILPGYDIISSPIPNVAGSEVVYFLPESYARELIRPQIIVFVLISVAIACMIISVSYLTSHFLAKRVINAVNTMNSDLNNILNAPINSGDSGDDIDQITLRVRKLVQNSLEHCARLEHYEAENLRMELELLQMRFNPHLLYNTLEAIRHQVKNPDARSVIASMCHYYRIVLNNGHLIIRLKDEFEMIKEYLSIEKFAYRLENIEYSLQIDDQIKDCTIIKHLLQPIVENALSHGLRPDHQGGLLQITATAESECICVKIMDNGVGMSPEETKKLLQAPSASVAGHGYGIYNVQQRIQVYYGKEYGLQISSSIGQGTTVTLRIPATTSD